jgi:hypothetical protein
MKFADQVSNKSFSELVGLEQDLKLTSFAIDFKKIDLFDATLLDK